MAFCPTCGAQIADGATCPKCAGGASIVAPTAGLADNVAGALAYVTSRQVLGGNASLQNFFSLCTSIR